MEVLVTICARGGSKGVPGKNIKLLNGKPLLHYSLALATKIQTKFGADIQLSTDSEEILKAASDFGYNTNYIRPQSLARDNSGKISAIKDAWKYAQNNNKKEYDYLIDLDVTSPLRTMGDIEKALNILSSNPEAVNIFSVSPAKRNPYFNMVELQKTGFVKVVCDNKEILSRQSAPEVYDMNASFYIFSKEFLLGSFQTTTTERSLAFVMDHICFDLDDPMDFIFMESILDKNFFQLDL